MAFAPARRSAATLKLLVEAPSGFGKTYTALQLGRILGERVAVIDSERDRAKLYAVNAGEAESTPEVIRAGKGRWRFDHLTLESKTPQEYLEAIREAAKLKYDVLVIDSFSHSWISILDMVTQAGGWVKAGKVATPLERALIDAVLSFPGHVIATVRSKAEFVIEKNEKGQNTLRKIGMASVAREGTEFEFTMVFTFNEDGTFTVSKSSCGDLPRDSIHQRTAIPDVAQILQAWLADGAKASPLEVLSERIRYAASDAELTGLLPDVTKHLASSPKDRDSVLAVYKTRKKALLELPPPAELPPVGVPT